MDKIPGILRSKKFWGAVIGAVVVTFQASYFEGHPQMLDILITTASLFGITVLGQSHADANDKNYKSKK